MPEESIPSPNLNLLRHDRTSKFLYIDFESYNLCLHRDFNAPWQAGLILVQNNQVLNSRELLFNWGGKYAMKQGNPSYSHYSERTIQEKGLPPKKAFDIIVEAFANCDYIIGHNLLKFDVFILKELCALYGGDYRAWIPRIIDTKTLALAISLNVNKTLDESLQEFQFRFLNYFKKGLKTNLTYLCKNYNIAIDETKTHDSLYDLSLNLQVFNKQKYQLDI